MSNVGLRINESIVRPEKSLIEQFRGLPVANIGDSINRTFCLNAAIRPFNDNPLLGPALTVKVRPGDNLLLHKALDMAKPGDIIVVDGQGETANALIGELMVLWAIKLGIGGFVIDGAIRDVTRLRSVGIPVYAAGVTPAGPYKDGPGEINHPVVCGGVVVNPGDIVVGDADGIVVIQPQDAKAVLEKARAKSQAEQQTLIDIENGSWDRTWVDAALKEKGCGGIR
ncbi:RraA famliy [Noviherbaspirillum humi]|uniref:Putative 4-hydroxy-4-methyl-2-oxoglutarate aldolase n=1 Tax=Noviherbaspirillum humi TaxID=1688639 RepID=A0A239LDC1_9BURK|nr:RraA family protein [Noviherbaspirillum humi]SNT27952.1 RraA famliy [Noviherbaspirillum humi]